MQQRGNNDPGDASNAGVSLEKFHWKKNSFFGFFW